MSVNKKYCWIGFKWKNFIICFLHKTLFKCTDTAEGYTSPETQTFLASWDKEEIPTVEKAGLRGRFTDSESG